MRKGRFLVDFSDRSEKIMFPVDFAAWLRDHGREQDAREFVSRVNQYKQSVPRSDFRMDTVIHIAQEYAQVHDTSAGVEDPRMEAIRLLEGIELDGPANEPDLDSLPWDREEEMIQQAEQDAPVPVNMDEPEFPDAIVYLNRSDTMIELAARAVLALLESDYPHGAKQLSMDTRALLRHSESGEDLFHLIWSYVTVVPNYESKPAWAA